LLAAANCARQNIFFLRRRIGVSQPSQCTTCLVEGQCNQFRQSLERDGIGAKRKAKQQRSQQPNTQSRLSGAAFLMLRTWQFPPDWLCRHSTAVFCSLTLRRCSWQNR
jgi:hypothetical protein